MRYKAFRIGVALVALAMLAGSAAGGKVVWLGYRTSQYTDSHTLVRIVEVAPGKYTAERYEASLSILVDREWFAFDDTGGAAHTEPTVASALAYAKTRLPGDYYEGAPPP